MSSKKNEKTAEISSYESIVTDINSSQKEVSFDEECTNKSCKTGYTRQVSPQDECYAKSKNNLFLVEILGYFARLAKCLFVGAGPNFSRVIGLGNYTGGGLRRQLELPSSQYVVTQKTCMLERAFLHS